MRDLNRIANAGNPYQGDFKKVLCVCSAGVLRSPTAAVVLAQEPFNFNTRAAGLDGGFALVVVDSVLLAWADEIVCMEEDQDASLRHRTKKPIYCLNIPDSFEYRHPKLMKMIHDRYLELGPPVITVEFRELVTQREDV